MSEKVHIQFALRKPDAESLRKKVGMEDILLFRELRRGLSN